MTAHFFSLSRDGDGTVIAISGAFDAETVFDLRGQPAMRDVAPGTRVIVDLSATDFMDSSGVGFLVSLSRRGQREGWTLEIVGAAGQSQRLLQRIGWPTTLAS
ncbi:MAG: STAS domain-containing protein [Thalassobaculaceae bacterium]